LIDTSTDIARIYYSLEQLLLGCSPHCSLREPAPLEASLGA
jgi:hypothetical protein